MCVCYRPPDSPASFWDSLQTQIDLAKQLSINNIIIKGDLNSDPNSSAGPHLAGFANQNHLTIHVREPTRITETTATILDQFLSNLPYSFQDVCVLPPLSDNDHCTISGKILFKSVKKYTYQRRIWLYNKANFDDFRAALINFNWDNCFTGHSINDVCESWTTTFLNIAAQFIPNKIITVRPRDSPWYTSELRCMKRKVDRLHTNAKNSNNNPSRVSIQNK